MIEIKINKKNSKMYKKLIKKYILGKIQIIQG